MSQETAKFLDTAWRAADSAGSLIRESWLQPKEIDYKGAIDLVTSVDRESERKIVEIIGAFPTIRVLAEEETDHRARNNTVGSSIHWMGRPISFIAIRSLAFPSLWSAMAK
jgi:fructose-1,6-bisphosphatase/inositol monophosphatase family enzyme